MAKLSKYGTRRKIKTNKSIRCGEGAPLDLISFVVSMDIHCNVGEEQLFSFIIMSKKVRKMKYLSKAEIAVIKARIIRRDKYAEIASDYRINQGRIADLKFGRIYKDVEPADISDASHDL